MKYVRPDKLLSGFGDGAASAFAAGLAAREGKGSASLAAFAYKRRSFAVCCVAITFAIRLGATTTVWQAELSFTSPISLK